MHFLVFQRQILDDSLVAADARNELPNSSFHSWRSKIHFQTNSKELLLVLKCLACPSLADSRSYSSLSLLCVVDYYRSVRYFGICLRMRYLWLCCCCYLFARLGFRGWITHYRISMHLLFSLARLFRFVISSMLNWNRRIIALATAAVFAGEDWRS